MVLPRVTTVLTVLFKLIVVIALAGCAVSPNNFDDNKSITAGSGVLVVGLHTNWEGHNNPLLASLKLLFNGEGDSDYAYKTLTFQGKNHIAVIELPAKKYQLFKLSFGDRYLTLHGKSEFDVKPNVITYIGDITSDVSTALFSAGSTLKVDDKFEGVKAYLSDNYPLLASTYTIEKQLVEPTFKQQRK